MDQFQHLAKVRVAGSNLVFRSVFWSVSSRSEGAFSTLTFRLSLPLMDRVARR